MDATEGLDLRRPEYTMDSFIPNSKSSDLIKPDDDEETRKPLRDFVVYNRRWMILAIFVFYSASNSMQWIQFSIIANIIQKYYNVSSTWVSWTSMIYMFLYIILVFPGSWILDKLGLRMAAIFGCLGTCLGAWIKILGVNPDLFFVVFIGQSIVAASQVFILSLPAKLAAVWFGPNQVSSACSIGVFGNQLGIAIGFIFPSIMVKNSDDMNQIRNDLQLMFYSVAAFTTILAVLICIFFQKAPPSPPSASAALSEQPKTNQSSPFLHSIKNLSSNLNYIMLLISYGINVGVFYAISTLLNQIVLTHYNDAEEDAGRIGLCIVVAGMIGSVCCGIALDKTHKFNSFFLKGNNFSSIHLNFYRNDYLLGNFECWNNSRLYHFIVTWFCYDRISSSWI
ncbi:choline/ethanolamine transporter flvcr2a isoform X2 [Chironomus tepperi]|uniref:choline/ethanolamine transporter flvcr2a isoform X2 n=1 Tax=Chironomus tepperi TaxID=113505 RepID=UPI00391F19BD